MTGVPDTGALRSFTQLLAAIEDGELHRDLSVALTDIVAALADHIRDVGGKPRAKLTLTLAFATDGGVFEIAADIKVATPTRARARSIFWATPDNYLSRLNPRQQQLPFRDVSLSTQQEVL